MSNVDFEEIIENPRRKLPINWQRVRNLLLLLSLWLIFVVFGVAASYVWPVKYNAFVHVTQPNNGLMGDLNRAADLVASHSSVFEHASQLDNQLRVHPKDVLAEFGVLFNSIDSVRSFYIDKQLYLLDGFTQSNLTVPFLRAVARFTNSFSSRSISKVGVDILELEFTDARAETAAELLNNYVEYTAEKAVRNLLRQQLSKKDIVTRQLRDIIALQGDLSSCLDCDNRVDITSLKALADKLEDISITGDTVRPARIVSLASSVLSRPTPQPWVIISIFAVIGFLLAIVMLFLVDRPRHI